MIEKFKIFCAVAETRSFSKASKIVHITQPAVSLQIQAIEELFETKVFDRTGSSLRLTPAGDILYKHAREILKTYASLEKGIGKITGTIKGGVAIGASTTLGNHVLPDIIINFKKKHPKIKINLHIGNTRRIEDLLTSGFIDFGFVAGETSKNNIKIETIMPDELIFIVPPLHSWAKKSVISVFETIKEPFILREEGSGTRQKVEEYFESHGIGIDKLHTVLVLGSNEAIKEAVKAGIGISVISRLAVQRELDEGKLKAVTPKEGKILRNLSLIFPQKAHHSHAVEEFIFFTKKYIHEKVL
jgi:DNA-binding transcriptional LysR family regulator